MTPKPKIKQSSKIEKSSHDPRTRSEKSSVATHDEKVRKLQAEREKLLEAQSQGLSTPDDNQRLVVINSELEKYAATVAHANVVTSEEFKSSAAVEQPVIDSNTTNTNTTDTEMGGTDTGGTDTGGTDTGGTDTGGTDTGGTDTGGSNATGPNATGPNAAQSNTTRSNATGFNASVANTTEPEIQESSLQQGEMKGKMKEEPTKDSNSSTNRLVDDLNMAWDVNFNDYHVDSSLEKVPKEAFGHIMKSSQARYCVRYGSAEARSARFESALPNGSRYEDNRDVSQGSNRIVEKIVQHHRDKKLPLPINILSRVKILLVYWDSKMGVGHEAEIDVLDPDFPERRPHTRCFIFLDPKLYAAYDLVNKTGYSHETRSTMKLLMEGNDDRQKSITLHNIAVRLENAFEARWMSGMPGRPEPLRELVHERKIGSRRTKSPSAAGKLSASSTLVKPEIPYRQPTPLAESRRTKSPSAAANSSASSTFIKPEISSGQPLSPPEARNTQASTSTKSGMSLRQKFHSEFLDLFGLPENVTYADLTEKQQLLYPAQFTKWKAVNF